MLADDVLELEHAVAGMRRDRKSGTVGDLAGLFQQLDTAGLDLAGVEDASDAPVGGAVALSR